MESFMRYFVCVFGLVAVVHGGVLNLDAETLTKMKNAAETCQEKTKATPEDLQTLMSQQIPTTKSGQCFAACVKKELGLMNPDNSINLDKITAMMDKHVTDATLKAKGLEIVKKCNEEVKHEGDECLIAKEMMECGLKYKKEMNMPDVGF